MKGNRSVNPGVDWGVATPQIFGRTGSHAGGPWTGRDISYHVQEVCSKVVTFEDK